jgi:hypothetical protein
MTAHAKLSASGSAKWIGCPGSIAAEASHKDSSSAAAEEGTAAHELAEACLRTETDADKHIGEVFNKHTVDKDMAYYVQQYLDYCYASRDAMKSPHVFIEERVEFTDYVPEGFGTVDYGLSDATKLVAIDLKFGKGITVSSYENTQGLLYLSGLYQALSKEQKKSIKTVEIHIVQPRKSNFSTWILERWEFLAWMADIKRSAWLASQPDAVRVAGEKQCTWCLDRHNCVVLKKSVEDVIMTDFDDISTPDIESITDEQRVKIVEAKPLINIFMNAIEKDIKDRLFANEQVPGFKLVEGRANRKLHDHAEADAFTALGEDAYNKKLKGLGDLQKLISKDWVDDHCYKPPGSPTVALASDKRPAIILDTTEDFDDES